jgi:outer membrane receptor protein involved in Fe transport
MMYRPNKSRLLASAAVGVVVAVSFGGAAFAADQPQQPSKVQEVIVTGSRIPRTQTKTPAPVDLVPAQDLVDRGFTNVGDALNQVTANTPSVPVTPTASGPAGSGQTYPNLFNLGAGRTLTLVGGHRFVASSNPNTPSSAAGFGAGGTGQGNAVDTGLIPMGLLDHVEVVEAGGAAVYGSDAIAGVVNYVLKRDFEGVEMDVQGGTSWKDDHKQKSARVTAGHNFLDGRANVSVDLEYSKTDPLLMSQRNYPAIGRFSAGLSVIPDAHFYSFNNTGVIYRIPPAPVPICSGPNPNCFLYNGGGQALTFSGDGSSVGVYNPGVNAAGGIPLSPPFAEGGDGYRLRDLTALATGVERKTANFLGHIDITDHVKLSGQFLYDHELGDDPVGSQGVFKTVLSPAPENSLAFFKSNPWLTASDIATLGPLSPGWNAGAAPLFLSKSFNYLLPTQTFEYPTDTYWGVVQLDGDYDAMDRHFVWSAAYSHGEVDSKQEGWSVLQSHFLSAISATPTGLLCNVTVPGCVPLDPFGDQKPSAAQWAYIGTPIGYEFRNQEDDFLLTWGGDLWKLPGGEAKFSTAYEYRRDTAGFTPSAAQHAGAVFGQGAATPDTGGWTDTSEYAAELLVPLMGDNFTFSGVKGLDLSAQGRIADAKACGFSNGASVGCNEGQNTVWGLGLSLRFEHGLTLRASRSQNFRAPTLYQLFAPSSTSLAGGIQDPCDNRFVAQGPSPTTRGANCLALFAANPLYGTGPGLANPGDPAATRLAAFRDTAVNFSTAEITSGGNPALKNEISETTTYGLVFQPDFVPGGLTITADYLSIHLLNGITAFTPTNFADSCLDNPSGTAPTCAFFTRDSVGNINNAVSTTFNAESLQYKGEVVNVIYKFPLEWIDRHPDTGNMELQLEATHNDELRQSVGGVVTEAVGTVAEPHWVLRGDARYTNGPFRFTYQFFYLPASLVAQGATAANTATPMAGSNLTHSISGSWDFGHFQVRAGVNNLTNTPPSFPTLTYGDFIGRTYFVGLRARY